MHAAHGQGICGIAATDGYRRLLKFNVNSVAEAAVAQAAETANGAAAAEAAK